MELALLWSCDNAASTRPKSNVSMQAIGRNAATRVHSNPGSSADQFDWEGRKINGNRKKTPRKCLLQGRNLKVTTPEEGRGKEKVETCSVAVPSEVGFFWVQWRSSPHNLDQYRGKIEFLTLLADLRRHLNTIPHLRSLLQVSHDPNPRKKNASWTILAVPRHRKNAPVGQRLRNFSSDKTRKGAQGPFFHFFLAAVRALSSSTSKLRSAKEAFPFFFVAMALLWHQTWWLYHGSRHASLDPACFFFVSLYLRPLLTNEELSICSRTFVTSSMTATIEVLVLVVVLVFASVLEVLQSISCLPCAPQTSHASRENFCASFFFGSTTGHCPSPYQIVAIQRFWRRWATSHRKGALALDLFPVVELPLTDGNRHVWSIVTAYAVAPLASRQNAPSLYLGARFCHDLRSTFKKTHWLGHDTEHHGARAERRNSSITSRSTAVRHFFFYISRATSDLARQWCTVPHVAKLNVISPNDLSARSHQVICWKIDFAPQNFHHVFVLRRLDLKLSK